MKGFLWCPHCGAPHSLNTPNCPATGAALGVGAPRGQQRFAPGDIIGERYKVRRWGVEESVGLVYDATHVTTRRRVLVKVVHGDGVRREDRDAEILEMKREARAASMVEHPNVSPVLDYGTFGDGDAFLVREHTSGRTLASTLRADGTLPIVDAADILAQILSGLHALHAAGVVHRDLGTHNISMVQRAGCRPLARIGGLGRCSTPKLGLPNDPPSGIHYSSPEVLTGRVVDQRSDLFSCGVILFEMLTGRRPFEATQPDQVRAAILRDDRPSATHLRPLLGTDWLALLDKVLDKDPARRYQTALELQAALPTSAAAQRSVRSRLLLSDDDDEDTNSSMVSSAGTRGRTGVNGPSQCNPYIGRTIAGRYALESLIGSGTAGAVYKATHLALRRPVAVKVLHDRNRRATQTVERFKSEALVASRLDHPNITRVLDSGEEPDGTLYLVMEYLEGRSLEALIATEVRLSAERALRIAIQISSSLVVAHAAGIIHRDVKPENIIVRSGRDDDGTFFELAKVCDFGLAKLHHADAAAPGLTGVGVILGSPVYIAPEQIRGTPCDVRTDIYAAGVTLFEMLTGRLPHEADKLHELFQKKLNGSPTPLSVFLPDVDPLIGDVVMRAVASVPGSRHESAAELRSELIEALRQLETSPPSSKARGNEERLSRGE